MLFSDKNSLMKTAVCHAAMIWCSSQVRAMPGRTRATLFLSQGIPDKNYDLQFVLVAQIPCGRNLSKKEHRFDFGFAHSRFHWKGRVCSVPLSNLAFCLRGRTPKSMIHHL